MKATPRHLRDLKSIAAGEKVAYVDRLRRRYRGPAAFPDASQDLPVPVGENFAARLRAEGWSALYSRRAWTREIPSAMALVASLAWGFAADIASSASLWVLRKTGFARPSSSVGVLEAIHASQDGRPRATVRVPEPGGGWSRHSFRLVSDGEEMLSLGEGIEFAPPTARQRARLRPISPPSAVDAEGKMCHLSAIELLGVVSSHAAEMDFAGLWERVPLPVRHLGRPCLSPRLAGLYVHRKSGEAVLVFRGTNPLSIADWAVNVGATHGKATYQHRGAVVTTEAALATHPRLLLAGHSKGGGMAQFASAATGIPAVTFNSVGLPLREMGISPAPPAMVEHFVVKFDVVSNISGVPGVPAPGISGPLAALRGNSQEMLGGPSSVRVLPPPRARHRMCSLHSLESLRDALVENPFVIPSPFSTSRPPSYPLRGLIVDRKKPVPVLYEPRVVPPARHRPAHRSPSRAHPRGQCP